MEDAAEVVEEAPPADAAAVVDTQPTPAPVEEVF